MLMDPTLGRVIERWRAGDRDAFEEVVDRYGLQLLRTARVILRDEALAEGAFQALPERFGRLGGTKREVSSEARLDLAKALDQLSIEQRAAVALHYYQDLSVEETARVLKVPVDTVKSRLKTALRRLRGRIRDGIAPRTRARMVPQLALAGALVLVAVAVLAFRNLTIINVVVTTFKGIVPSPTPTPQPFLCQDQSGGTIRL